MTVGGGFDGFFLPLACLGLATYTAASKIRTFNSSMLDLSLGPSASNDQVARARTPKSNGRGRSVLQGFYPAAAPAKYRSVERMSASNLISSDSTPKIKLIY